MSEQVEHRVVFNIGTGTVVCSCGDYSASDSRPLGFGIPVNGVERWAQHLRSMTGLSLQQAYDHGWEDACADWMTQRRDPSYPLGRRRRADYPNRPTHTATTPAEVGDEEDEA